MLLEILDNNVILIMESIVLVLILNIVCILQHNLKNVVLNSLCICKYCLSIHQCICLFLVFTINVLETFNK